MDHKFGYLNLQNYIDDLIYLALPHEIYEAYASLLSLLHDPRLEVSQKLVPPTSKAICLGIEIDACNKMLSIPVEKLEKIKNMCNTWTMKTELQKHNYNFF